MKWQQIGRRGFLKRLGVMGAGLVGGFTGLKVLAQDGEFTPDPVCERIPELVDAFDPRAIFEYPECLFSISKDMNGEIVRQMDETLEGCEDPRSGDVCVTLKTIHELEMRVVTSGQPCDSDASDRMFDGDFRAELNFTHINDGNERGYHHGRFTWEGNDAVVIGFMSGMVNAGSHRGLESCDKFGHWEGQLEGFVIDGSMAGCCLRGNYMVNFDPAGKGPDGAVSLMLEGLLFCRCEG